MQYLTIIIKARYNQKEKYFRGKEMPTTQEDNASGIIDRWNLFNPGKYDQIGKMVQWDDGRYVIFIDGNREIFEMEEVELHNEVTANDLTEGTYKTPAGTVINILHVWEGKLFLMARYTVDNGPEVSQAVGALIQNSGPLVKI